MEEFQLCAQMYPPEIKPGCLLHAVLWHCRFQVNFTLKVPLFKSQKPFKTADFVDFIVSSDTYTYPSLRLSTLARKFPHLNPTEKK